MATKQLQQWPFGQTAIGFERLFDNLQYTATNQTTSYPPYNIIRHDELRHQLEIALAGFSEEDLTISHEKNILTVSGACSVSDEETALQHFIHKGISTKDFTRQFTLGEHVVVTDARMRNGLLVISLETVVPEEMKPKLIKIS